MADVALRPSYKASEVRKQRDLLLASILQRKDQPTQLAAIAFNQLLFPEGHPYHNPVAGDSATVATLDSAKVRAFYTGAFVPGRAKFVVVGDVSLAEVRPLLDARFGAWKRGSALPIPAVTSTAVRNDQVQVYLVDKPGAAQSVIYVGAPGADRARRSHQPAAARTSTATRRSRGHYVDAGGSGGVSGPLRRRRGLQAGHRLPAPESGGRGRQRRPVLRG